MIQPFASFPVKTSEQYNAHFGVPREGVFSQLTAVFIMGFLLGKACVLAFWPHTKPYSSSGIAESKTLRSLSPFRVQTAGSLGDRTEPHAMAQKGIELHNNLGPLKAFSKALLACAGFVTLGSHHGLFLRHHGRTQEYRVFAFTSEIIERCWAQACCKTPDFLHLRRDAVTNKERYLEETYDRTDPVCDGFGTIRTPYDGGSNHE